MAFLQPRYIILYIVIAVLIVMIILLWRWTRKQNKQRDEQQAVVDEMAQTYTVLVIDKKKVRMKDADIPQEIKDSTPWYSRRAKVPIVKVKAGPKVMNMIADNDIYDLIPVKTEIKATIAGIYITNVRGIRTSLEKKPEKKGIMARLTGGFPGRR